MQFLTWANISIPLPFVTAISWSRNARQIEHYGGYVSSRGFECSEISVQITVTPAICDAFGIDTRMAYQLFQSLATDKRSESGVVTLGGMPILPNLEFTLTNINKTEVTDRLNGNVPHTLSADLTLSGVKTVKNVSRNRVLDYTVADVAVPKCRLSVRGKTLEIGEQYTLTHFVTTQTGCNLEIQLCDDSQIVNRDDFLNALMELDGQIEIDLPTGKTKFYIVSAALVDDLLMVDGSVFPPKFSQSKTWTFRNTTLSDIVRRVCSWGGVKCDCRVNGMVDYYSVTGSPLEILKELQASAGFIISKSGNRIVLAGVPENIQASHVLDGYILDDNRREPVRSVYWYDGINAATATNTLDGEGLKVRSVFRSSHPDEYARNVLKFLNYSNNFIEISTSIDVRIVNHSAVEVQKDDAIIPILCDHVECDWLFNQMTIEGHYV